MGPKGPLATLLGHLLCLPLFQKVQVPITPGWHEAVELKRPCSRETSQDISLYGQEIEPRTLRIL